MILIILRLKMCRNAVKMLPFVLKCVSNRYKTKEICDKVVLENGEMLMFISDISDWYKD